MKFDLIFIAFPSIGHLRPSVEIAKLLVEREKHLSISMIIPPLFNKDEVSSSNYIASLPASSTDRLRYYVISAIDQPPEDANRPDTHMQNQVPQVRRSLTKLLNDYSTSPDSPKIAGFIFDMFCMPMIDLAKEFNLPSYMFFTSNAGALALGFHVQELYDEGKYDVNEDDVEDSEVELNLPSLTRPYPVKCLPHGLVSKEGLPFFVNQAKRYKEMKGILVNTVAELEPSALKFLSSGETPPTYPVGPLLHLERGVGNSKEEILRWLDDQPLNSVVFLCFGSMGGFDEEQVREIAVALERTGHRFLWSIRHGTKNIGRDVPKDFTNLEEILPEGFSDRTKERGKVIGWAPQVDVLQNPAVGGFVTHCGWNSTLESLWFGVPTAAWPLYAEQKFNAFEMVEELGLAVEIKKYWRNDHSATAEEIEKGIKCLMEQDSDVRKRVKEMSEKCHVASMECGSSQNGLKKFIQDVIENIPRPGMH